MPVTAEPATSTKREEILDVAEAMIRTRGYNAFSTRDVADAVGIKAASVHYYFPTKADIGAAVTERYTARFINELGDSGRFEGKPKEVIDRWNAAIGKFVTDPAIIERFAATGTVPFPPEMRSPAAHAKFLTEQFEFYAKMFAAADVKQEEAK